MKTLDELLSERAQAEYQESLGRVLDPATWSAENRDDKLSEIRKLAEGVCTVSETFVKELLDTKIDGQSILWHKIKEQFILGEIELLMGFRDELDTLEVVTPEIPISYEWLNEQIRIRHLEISNTNLAIAKATSPEGEVEDL